MASPEVLSPVERQPENPIWVDLTSLNRAALSTVQERYGLPPEVMTYFLLHYQSAKLIHAGPALFLVTFLAIPSARYLFTTRELKMCATPTVAATLCGPAGRTQSDLMQTLPLPSLSGERIGQVLCGLLEGTVGSYEAIVRVVEKWHRDNVPQDERQRQRKQVEKLVRFLREEQAFLGSVVHEGGKLLAPEESRQIKSIEERVSVLARVAWETLRRGAGRKTSLEIVPTTQEGGDA
jgi:Mg2+ and Co2+ transporter CorA